MTIDRRRRPQPPATAPTAPHDRDVPAGDRHDVADAGRRERGATSRSTRSRSPMRIPAASPASGSGRTRRQQVAGVASPALQDGARVGGSSEQRHRAGLERAPRVEAREVLAVRTVRARAGATADLDPVARLDRWVAWQRGGDAERRGTGLDGPQRRDLLAVARRPDGLDDHRPGARPVRSAGHHGRRRTGKGPDREDERPIAMVAAIPARPPGQPESAQHQRAGRGQHTADSRGSAAATKAATVAPVASQPLRGTVRAPPRARAPSRRSSRRGRPVTAAHRPRRTAPPRARS